MRSLACMTAAGQRIVAAETQERIDRIKANSATKEEVAAQQAAHAARVEARQRLNGQHR